MLEVFRSSPCRNVVTLSFFMRQASHYRWSAPRAINPNVRHAPQESLFEIDEKAIPWKIMRLRRTEMMRAQGVLDSALEI